MVMPIGTPFLKEKKLINDKNAKYIHILKA